MCLWKCVFQYLQLLVSEGSACSPMLASRWSIMHLQYYICEDKRVNLFPREAGRLWKLLWKYLSWISWRQRFEKPLFTANKIGMHFKHSRPLIFSAVLLTSPPPPKGCHIQTCLVKKYMYLFVCTWIQSSIAVLIISLLKKYSVYNHFADYSSEKTT